jgi:hypothetical protein
MKEFIVKANGRFLLDNIVLIILMALIYIGTPMIVRNYLKTNRGDILLPCLMIIMGYSIATVCMYLGITKVTQTISFNETGIVVQRVLKKVSFSKEELTYDIDYFTSSQGITQQSVFIKAGGKVYIFKEKEVENYPRAVEYLKKNCKKEKIYK